MKNIKEMTNNEIEKHLEIVLDEMVSRDYIPAPYQNTRSLEFFALILLVSGVSILLMELYVK